MTHCERVMALLRDGKPHTHHELYGLHVIAHSRVADLRKQGHHIACWAATDRGERVSVYQLLPALPAAVESGQPGLAAAGSASLSEPDVVGIRVVESPSGVAHKSLRGGGSIPPTSGSESADTRQLSVFEAA